VFPNFASCSTVNYIITENGSHDGKQA